MFHYLNTASKPKFKKTPIFISEKQDTKGIGVRAASRLTELHQQTILNVLEVAVQKATQLMEDRAKNIEAKFVSVDEMFGFVGCLQQNTTPDDPFRGDQYIHVGIEQTTKFIICWRAGKRDRDNAREIMRDLRAKTMGWLQLTTDNFNAYSGWSGAIRNAFGGQIDYGTETKHFATEYSLLCPCSAPVQSG